jgi:hypothetical protein
MNQVYGSGSPKVRKGIIGIIYLKGLASYFLWLMLLSYDMNRGYR